MINLSWSLLRREMARKLAFFGVFLVAAQSSFYHAEVFGIEEKEPMPVTVIVTFNTKEDKIDSFTRIMSDVKVDLPKVDGCTGVTIFRSTKNKNTFTLVETWESKKLHQAHLERLAKDGTWDVIASHLSKDPEDEYYTEM